MSRAGFSLCQFMEAGAEEIVNAGSLVVICYIPPYYSLDPASSDFPSLFSSHPVGHFCILFPMYFTGHNHNSLLRLSLRLQGANPSPGHETERLVGREGASGGPETGNGPTQAKFFLFQCALSQRTRLDLSKPRTLPPGDSSRSVDHRKQQARTSTRPGGTRVPHRRQGTARVGERGSYR